MQSAKLRNEEPLINDYEEYIFPVLSQSQEFDAPEMIREAIFAQAYDANCQGLERVFNYRVEKMAGGKRAIEFRCRTCWARMRFIEGENGMFRQRFMDNKHIHKNSELSSAQRHFLGLNQNKYNSANMGQRPTQRTHYKTKSSKKLDVIRERVEEQHKANNEKEYSTENNSKRKEVNRGEESAKQKQGKNTPTQSKRKEQNKSKTLQIQRTSKTPIQKQYEPWIQNGFTIYLKTNQGQKTPSLIVAVSDRMKIYYQRSSELISINQTPFSYKMDNNNTYHLTAISLFISTNKQVFVGYIIHTKKNTTASLYWGLKYFFHIHGNKKPTSIVTDYNVNVCKLFDIWIDTEQNKPKIVHLLDPAIFLQQAKSILGQKELSLKMKNILTNLIEQCEPKQAQKHFQTILAIENSERFAKLGEYLISVREKIWRSVIPSNFIGFALSCQQTIKQEFCSLESAQDIPQLVQQLVYRQQKLISKLYQNNQVQISKKYNRSLEYVFNDWSLKQIASEIQPDAFKIFMSNYIKMFSEEGSVKIVRQGKESNKQKSPSYIINIDQKSCSCGYPTKMGFPCSHIIAIAKRDNINYKTLINPRWRVPIGQKNSELPINVKN